MTGKDTIARPDVVIIQQYPMTYFGVIAIEAHLRQAGYRMEVLIDAFENNLIQALRALNPKIVGFSVFSTEHSWLVTTARRVHQAFPDTKIIVGGVHAMVFSEMILADTEAQMVCFSDGENVLIDVINELGKSKPDWSSINNIAYKTETGRIFKNSQAPLVQYKDDVIEERDVYFKRYPALAQDTICYFISSRGCPFSCSFCYNSYLRKSIGKTGYLRRKSPGNFLQEIMRTINKFGAPSIFFIDDLFTFDKAWLRAFLPQYKAKVGLPFVCMTRAKILDEETAEMLAVAGCHSASFGIETGNEQLRKTVLNKPISNEEMIACSNLLGKHGITVRASSMFCLPDETVENALETVELNIECKVDLAASMLLIPYPETAIVKYMQGKKLISANYSLRDIPVLAYKTSVLNMPDKKKIMNVHFLLYYFVKYPWLFKKFKGIIRIEGLNPLFYILFLLGCFIRNKNENRLSWGQTLTYAWHKRSLMFQSKARRTV